MTVFRQTARVLPGHRVEIVVPELAEGEIVDVIVSPHTVRTEPGQSLIQFLDSLPDGPRAFATWEAYEEHLRGRRDERPSLYDRLQDLIGQAHDLPADASEQIDHYVYGAAKRP